MPAKTSTQTQIPAQSAELIAQMSTEQLKQAVDLLTLAASKDYDGVGELVRGMTPEAADLLYRALVALDEEAQTSKRERERERDGDSFTQEDYNAIVYCLYEEYIEQVLMDESNPDHAEGKRVQKRFAELAGVAEGSPLAIGYVFFWAGVGKGLELATRIGDLAPAEQGG